MHRPPSLATPADFTEAAASTDPFYPDMGTHAVLMTVMPKFGPEFQDVIDKFKARAEAETAWQAAHAPKARGVKARVPARRHPGEMRDAQGK